MENEFLILLQAKLDEAKSKGNVNADIDKIQGQIDKLKIQAEIDPKIFSDLIQRIEKILNRKIDISNIGIDPNKAVQSAQQTGKQIGNAVNQGVSQGLGNIEKLESFQKSLLNAGMDSTLVSSVADEIGRLNVQIDSLNQSVSNMSGGKNVLSVNIAGVDELGQSVKLVRQFDVETGELVKTIESVSTAQQKTTSTIEKDITTYTNKLKDLQTQYSNANIDYSEFNKVFDAFKNGETTVNQLSVAFNELKNSAKASVQNLKSQDSSLNEIQQTINNMRDFPSMIDALKTEMSELKDQTKVADISIDDLSESYNELKSVMDSVGGKVPLTDEWTKKYRELMSTVVSLTKQVETLKRVESSDNSLVKAKDISYKVDLGNYDKDFKVLTESFKRLGLSAEEIEVRVKDVSVALDKLKGKNLETLIQDEKEFVTALKKSQNEARILKTDLENIYNPKRQMNLSTNIQNWLSKNTRAANDAKQSLQEYYRELTGGRVSVDRLEFIEQELKKIDAEQRGLGKLGKNLKDQFTEAGKSFTQWLSVSSAVMLGINQLRKMPKAVYEIDTAMTNLYKVTDETSSKYNQFLESANESAQSLGRSVSSLVEQTSKWAKLGFDIDTSSNLAKTSSIYANVGEVDDDTAVSDLVTAMKAFNIEASDSITIVDKFNKLGNEFATSAKELGDGLSRSASAMATAGTDINKTLAMLTGGVEITQNASEFGNFLKIGSMRIRGMKGALEELGEGVDETVDSISKVQTQILNRTNGKVNIFDDLGNFRDYYDIMEDISKIYNELSDTNKADLTEILFGKQRGNQGAALIQAFQSGQIQKALEATLNAQGSAMEEQEKWLESLEAKTQQLEAAFQSLSSTVLDSDLLKWFVDLGTNGTKALESITKFLTPLGTFLTGAGIFASVKNVGRPKMFGLICY